MAQNSAKASSVPQVSLDNLTDVSISSPVVNNVLTYNGSTWVNQATQGDMLKSVYDTDLDGVVDSAEKEVLQVRNATGSTILKGKVVYINGAIGQMPTITLADADTEVTSSKTIGLTLADIPNNTNGYIITSGTFHNVNTGAFSDGNTLWLSSTAGDMVATSPPAEPAHAVFIGYVAYAHNTNGKIVVAIQNGYELDELHGVKITTPLNNDTLKYDSGTGLWVNSPSGTVTSVGLTTGTTGTDVNVSGSPITGSGSFTLNIPTASATNRGVLSTTDWSTFNGKQSALSGTGFVKISGTTISYDNSTYYLASNPNGYTNNTGTVTSVAALTLGTTGTDLSSSIATGTTTPVITLNVPTASASNRGALSSTDWSTFNGKQAALVSGTNIKTVNSTSLLGSGDVSVGVTSVTGTAPISSSGGATPAISIATANTTTTGALTSTDWNTFNSKQGAITLTTTGTSGAATFVGNTLNIPQYSGTNIYNSDGTLSALRTVTMNGKNLIFADGTGSSTFQVNMDDGTVSSLFSQTTTLMQMNVQGKYINITPSAINISGFYTMPLVAPTINQIPYASSSGVLAFTSVKTINSNSILGSGNISVGTVTSVAALTLGTAGTDLSSTVANGTTTPVITLNVPTASATNRGALSAADWSTFNNKQGAITLTTTGTSGAATLVGNTLNIPQYNGGTTAYDYGTTIAMSTFNYLT